LKVYNVNQII
jgi:hypothetical protein